MKKPKPMKPVSGWACVDRLGVMYPYDAKRNVFQTYRDARCWLYWGFGDGDRIVRVRITPVVRSRRGKRGAKKS